MRAIRSTLAVLVAATAILVATSTAGAGQAVATSIDYECDTTTGNFVVVLTVENLTDLPGEIEGVYGALEGSEQLVLEDAVFVPNPVPGGGTSTSTFEIPGNSTFVGVDLFVDFSEGSFEGGESAEIGEPCELVPTTTTAPSSTNSEVAVEEVARPRFTG